MLIATVAASVNPIDWKVRFGNAAEGFSVEVSGILGRDVSGVVQAVGPQVKHFKVGDKVMALANATYAELVAVRDSDATHVPDGLDLVDAAAIPLVALTGDQLVRLAAKVRKGQTVLVSGALGSVGRAAVHSAKKLGARVIAGVRGSQLEEADALGVAGALAIDDADAVSKFEQVDVVADTVGGEVAGKLIAKVKDGGTFGYAATLPEGAAGAHPKVTVTRVLRSPTRRR